MLELREIIDDSGSDIDTYSVYENPNKEMVNKIKSLDIDLKISNNGFGVDKLIWKFHKKQDNGNIMLINDDGDFSSISEKEYKKKKKKSLLNYINQEFNVGDVFNKYVLPVNIDGETIYAHNPHYLDYGDFGRYNSVNPQFISDRFKTSTYISKTSVGHIKFQNYISYPMTALHLQEDGSIINRDYNIDFNKTDDIDKKKTLEKFYSEIDKYVPEKIEKTIKGSTYFINEKYALKICKDGDEVYLEFIPYMSGRNYYERGNSYCKVVKPADKNIEVVDRQELKDNISKKIDQIIVTDEKINSAIKEFVETKNRETFLSGSKKKEEI